MRSKRDASSLRRSAWEAPLAAPAGSMLLRAARRAAKARGYSNAISYTLREGRRSAPRRGLHARHRGRRWRPLGRHPRLQVPLGLTDVKRTNASADGRALARRRCATGLGPRLVSAPGVLVALPDQSLSRHLTKLRSRGGSHSAAGFRARAGSHDARATRRRYGVRVDCAEILPAYRIAARPRRR